MAETYFNFSRSLKESERPADLKGADMEKYEADLDEAAYPFEEKAIKVHEKNMEMLHAGVFNAWTEKSLGRLAEMVPGRYAKSEMSSGFIGTIDHYVYRTPLAQAAIQAASNANATPGNAGTTPGNTGTPPNNGGTTPSNAGATPNNNGATPSSSGTSPSNGGTAPSNPEHTTQNNPDQTTHPASVAANDGVVKNANPH
jgi:hypothetical protein